MKLKLIDSVPLQLRVSVSLTLGDRNNTNSFTSHELLTVSDLCIKFCEDDDREVHCPYTGPTCEMCDDLGWIPLSLFYLYCLSEHATCVSRVASAYESATYGCAQRS